MPNTQAEPSPSLYFISVMVLLTHHLKCGFEARWWWHKEVEAQRMWKQISLSSRVAWSTERVPGQPGLHRESLLRKTSKTKKTNKNKEWPT
jgi:hypothetical protein